MKKKDLRKRKIVSLVLAMALVITSVQPIVAVAETQSITSIVNSMTTEEKICQTLMVDFRSWNGDNMTVLPNELAKAIGKYKFGGFLIFTENTPDNAPEMTKLLQLTKDIQKASISAGGLPMLIATDQEGGQIYRPHVCIPTSGNMALAATGDSNNAWAAGKIIGEEMNAYGINTVLGPVVDINSNAANSVIGVRSFGDEPQIVIDYSSKMIRGITEAGAISCVKHFPGHGDVAEDSHNSLPVIDKSLDQLKNYEFKPFQNAIEMGVDMIMTAHIACPEVDSSTILSTKTGKEELRPATMSKKLLTDELKGKMKFDGIVITDAMNMGAVQTYFDSSQAIIEALAAGADMITMPAPGISSASELSKLDGIISDVAEAVRGGKISQARLNDAVKRILTVKQKHGVLDYKASQYTESNCEAKVRSTANLQLERKLAAKGVTVVKNSKSILPLKLTNSSKVLMLTPYENELAQQGLGINHSKRWGCMPTKMGVEMYCYQGQSEVQGELQEKIDWANVVIVSSEIASAKAMAGENWLGKCPSEVVNYCSQKGKKVIVMSVSNPYDIQLYSKANAIVAVYGCKGSTMDATQVLEKKWNWPTCACGPNIVAGLEVIFGTYAATGELPIDIPKFDKATGNYLHQTVYNKGYGIKFSKKKHTTVQKVITRASSLREGKVEHRCSVCGQVIKTEKLKKIKKWSASPATYAYTGKTIKPKAKVTTYGTYVLKAGTDYDLTPNKTFKAVGKYKVQLLAKNRYKFRRTLEMTIVPATPKISKVSRSGGNMTIKMSKAPSSYGGGAFQYQICRKGSSKWYSKASVKKSVTFKRLKASSKYKVRVRAYKRLSGKIYYGAWKSVTK